VYDTLLQLYAKYPDPGSKGRALQCLGFLFRAQPTLMTLETSAAIMDEIFSSSQEEMRGRLLKIIQDFLVSEASKHNTNEKGVKGTGKADNKVNMAELVGNTDGFADSGCVILVRNC
jgi:cohesin loading factor subunit SCC2